MSTVKVTPSDVRSSETDKGILIELSPYDIPRTVKGTFDKQAGVFHIDFEYPDKEESQSRSFNHKLNIKVGKHSGKILGFEIKVAKFDIKEIALTIQAAVDEQLPRLEKFNERENYKLVSSLVQRHKEPLFAELSDRVPA
jgi:hypothetical protein